MSSAQGQVYRSEVLYDLVLEQLRQQNHKLAKEIIIEHREILPACWLEVLERVALHYEACFAVALVKQVKKHPDPRCSFQNPDVIVFCRDLSEKLTCDFSDRSKKDKDFHDKFMALYTKVQKALTSITGNRASKAA
jgi:hypothetical protein